MRSLRPTLLRRIVGLAAVAASGLAAAALLYGLSSGGEPAPGAEPTGTTPTTRPAPTAGTQTMPGVGTGNGDGSSAIDEALDGLELANLAFNSPRTMRLNEPVVIQLLLSGGRTIEELQEELEAIGEEEGEQIRVSDTMEAQLTGVGFAIEAVTPATQLVATDGVTEWKWEVEPTKTGERRLHLALSALIDLGGKERTYTVRTFERTLEVRVAFRERLETFAEDNWQWLWTALLVPLGAVLLQRRRQRKVPPSGSTPPDTAARPTPH